MLSVALIGIFFFVQAEDGIRDLVRSRGLGDVYKRQVLALLAGIGFSAVAQERVYLIDQRDVVAKSGFGPVSYTHLTLPTSDLV